MREPVEVQRIALCSIAVVPCDATNWTIGCKRSIALALANKPKIARATEDAEVKDARERLKAGDYSEFREPAKLKG